MKIRLHQNLEDRTLILYCTNDQFTRDHFHIELSWLNNLYHHYLELGVMGEDLKVSFSCGLFTIYFVVEILPEKFKWIAYKDQQSSTPRERTTGIHLIYDSTDDFLFNDWFISFEFWKNTESWNTKTDQGFGFNWHPMDLLLGKMNTEKIEHDTKQQEIAIQDEIFDATINIYSIRQSRKRFPIKREIYRFEVRVEAGILTGKVYMGELDKTFALSQPFENFSLPKNPFEIAIAECQKSIINTRERYDYGPLKYQEEEKERNARRSKRELDQEEIQLNEN